MNPAWLIDEYASIRFTSRCTRPRIAPTSSVRMAINQSSGCQSVRSVPKVEKKTRSSAANPPALARAVMKPVAGVGAPW